MTPGYVGRGESDENTFHIGIAVVVAALMPWGAPATAQPTEGEIDIVSAELAGSAGGASVNVFGTLRCAGAGPLNLDVLLEQESTGGVGFGSNNGLTCPGPGELVKWVVTATGSGFLVGDKVTITALAEGSTIAMDVEDHVLRWGR